MRKRLLACVLALAMATTLLPMSVFAATTDEGTTVPSNPLISATEVPSVSSEKDSKVQIEKTVKDDSSIELSAYVTGAVKTTSKPLDIVLVLDVSGSMGDPYAAPEYQATAKTTWSYNDIKNDKNNKYYFKSGKSYYPVYADTYGLFETNYVLCADGYGSWLDDSFSDSSRDPDAIIYHKSLYIMTSAQKNKIDALKTAVNGFIESVSADATENSVTHNISIVKFAGNKRDEVGNDTYRNGQFMYNYSQVVVSLTDVSNGKTKLTNAVQALRPAGATRADYGLELAQAELAKSSEGRQKVIIMFTDGVPSTFNTFDNEVASDAIKAAKGLKGSGAQVFSVGIFENAPMKDMTNYMNAVSSNYLTASYDKGQGGGWNWNLGTQTSNNYYKDASALDLSAVFQQIQSEMASVEVKSTAVLSDTLSACFKLSTDASKAVTAEVQSISKDGKTWTGDTDQPTLTVETNGKDITVTGFDYGANPVINKGTAEAPDWTGKRVVLTIPFEPDTGYTGWVAGEKNYFTNDTDTNKAGLRDGSETYNELTKSPTAPVTGYTVTYDWTDLPEGVAATPNKPAQAVLIPGQTFTKDNTNYTAEGYTFDGWGDSKYGTDQTLQPTDGNYTMPASDVTITGTWTKNEIPPQTYSVSYEWTGLVGVTFTGEGPTPPSAKSGLKENESYTVDTKYKKGDTVTSADGTVYVFSGWKVTTPATGTTINENGTITMPPAHVILSGTWAFVQNPATPVTVDLSNYFKKKLDVADGSTLPNPYSETFTLAVSEQKADDPTLVTYTGTATVTNSTDAFSFNFATQDASNAGKLTFTEKGTHTYTVAETSKVTNVTNDPNLPYTMTIKVEKDDTANALTAAVSFTDKAGNPVVTADTAAITVTNTYEDNTPAPTTGTLTIAKGINLSAYPEGAVYREAADGHTFAFLVKDEEGKVVATPTIRYSSVFDNGMEYAVNKTEVTLPFGTYTVEEVMETANLGYDTDTHLFKYSAKAFSGSFYGLGEAKTLSAEHPSDTVIVVNDYTTWESGFGKHASALNGTTSDITLTLPKGFIQPLVVVNSNSEVPTICAKLVDEIGSGTVNVGGKDYTYDFAFVTDAEISLELDSQTKVVAQKGEPAEDGSITYTFISKDGKEFAELVYCPENRNSQEHFTLFIYDGKYFAGSAVKLHYQVKLDPSGLTTKGTTYGTLNEYGKDTTKDSALLTNNSAILYKVGYVDNELVVGPIVTFPLPTVSYTVSGGNGGGGGHSRPTLNTEDHYGYIIGYPDGTVQPGGSITRAEVATIFFRMLTDSSRTEFWSQTNSFSDVPSTAWFNNAVSTLTKAGIIAGYEDGTFQPNATITRAEFATIAVRFFEASYDGKDFFTDIDGHWAQQYINDAANAGLVNGYEDGTFGPNKAITRAEAMTLVNRALDRHPDADHFLKDMITWPDNSDTTAWYYEAVQEATNSHEYTMKTNTDKTKYEDWTKLLKMRDWKAFEAAWSNANSASNPGEVMGK